MVGGVDGMNKFIEKYGFFTLMLLMLLVTGLISGYMVYKVITSDLPFWMKVFLLTG